MTGEIEFWRTRSFWLLIATAVSILARQFGLDLDEGALADIALQVVPLVTMALAYRERMNPKKRVVFRKAAP